MTFLSFTPLYLSRPPASRCWGRAPDVVSAPFVFQRLRSLASSGLLSFGLLAGSGCAHPAAGLPERTDLSAELETRGYRPLRPETPEPAVLLPPGLALENGLGEREAVAIALWNNAAFQESLVQLGFARADLAQAGLLANPTLSLLFPTGPKQLEFTLAWPVEALWLRPKRRAIAESEARRVAQALLQSGLDLVRDVRVALVELDLAVAREGLSREALSVRAQLRDIARERFRLGDASELDALAADAEHARASEDSRRLATEVLLGRERLARLLGWPLGETRVAPLPPPSPVDLDGGKLEATALAARPDLRAAEIALESAARRSGLAEAEVFSLSALLDANGSGREGFEAGPGVSLPIPLFNQNQGNRLRARAEIERAGWSYLGVRQKVVAEVRESRLRCEQAWASLAAFEARVLPPLAELDRVSRLGFGAGDLEPAVMAEASRQFVAAQLRVAELRADARRARVELERAVGSSAVPAGSVRPLQP